MPLMWQVSQVLMPTWGNGCILPAFGGGKGMLTAECPPLQPPPAALVLGCPLPGDGALRGWCISQGHLKSLSGATLFFSSLLFPTLVGLG